MKQFKVFENPQGQFEAVKQGWSWPGFCFGFIWALVKKMWVLGAVIFAIFFGLGVLEEIMGQSGKVIDLFSTILGLIVSLVFGAKGNSMREENLISRGYELADTVSAANTEGAIALHIKNQSPSSSKPSGETHPLTPSDETPPSR